MYVCVIFRRPERGVWRAIDLLSPHSVSYNTHSLNHRLERDNGVPELAVTCCVIHYADTQGKQTFPLRVVEVEEVLVGEGGHGK